MTFFIKKINFVRVAAKILLESFHLPVISYKYIPYPDENISKTEEHNNSFLNLTAVQRYKYPKYYDAILTWSYDAGL